MANQRSFSEQKIFGKAHELYREEWLRADLSVLATNGVPVCKASAKLTARH